MIQRARSERRPDTRVAGGVSLIRFASWSAYMNGGFALVGFALTGASLVSGGPLRVLAELAFLASTLGLLPIPWVLHRLGHSRSAVASVFALVVGLGGALGTVAVQASAVLGLSTSGEQSAPLVIAFGAIGVWMIISNHLARADRTLSDGLAWLGVIAGAGLVLAAVVLAVPGFRTSDPTVLPADPVTAAGLVLSVLAHFASLAWAMWLGRALGRAGTAGRPRGRRARRVLAVTPSATSGQPK